MNLKDVKAITIPQGSVKKIEDSNGNVIWGSSDAYPYRQLECLNMKNAYIVTDFAPKQGYYYADCKFPSTFTGQWGMIYGAEGWANNAATRWWPGAMQSNNSGRLFQRIKAQGDVAIANLSALNTSHLYQVGARTYFTNNTSGRYWIHLRDKSNNMNYIYSQYYNSTTLSMNLSTFNTIGINVATRKNASGNFLAQSGYVDFSLYQFYIKSNADSDPVYFDAYPVQRKSDGVCGLYDIYGSKFYPCSGTASSTCAGPIVSEYWDPASLL